MKENKIQIILCAVAVICGIAIGILLSFSDRNYIKLLSQTDENLIKYVVGSADNISIFWHRLFSGLIALAIVFLLTLNYYSGFISLFYISYQNALVVLAIIVGTQYYGFSFFLSTIILSLPANILLIFIISVFYLLCQSRATKHSKYKLKFSSTFSGEFWLNTIIIILLLIIFEIVANLIAPLIFRGIFIINY